MAEGIRKRHSRSCKSRKDGSCNCDPSIEVWVWSARDGKKIYKTFSGKGAALAAKGWRQDAGKQVRERTLRAPTGQTLKQAVDEFIEGATAGRILNKREQTYKPAVIRNYKSALNLHVVPELGHRKLSDITMGDLLMLKEDLQGEGISGSTVRNCFVPLQTIYRRARRMGVVATNPTLDLSLPVAGHRDRAVDAREASDLLDALPDDERAIYATAFYAGLRRGELRALRAENVTETFIDVKHGWDDVGKEQEPKSKAGVRRVPLTDALGTILKAHVERTGRSGEDFLFGSTATQVFDSKMVTKHARAAWTTANEKRAEDELPLLSSVTLHEARHSFASYLIAAGVSETSADRYMGHSNGSVSARYRHELKGQMTADVRLLNTYLGAPEDGNVVSLGAVA